MTDQPYMAPVGLGYSGNHALVIPEREFDAEKAGFWRRDYLAPVEPPYYVGIDPKTSMVALGVVDSLGQAVCAAWMPLNSYGLLYGAAEQAGRWISWLVTQRYFEGRYGAFVVEEVPFHSRSSNTRDKINRVGYACGAALAMHFPYEFIHRTTNWGWKNAVMKMKGADKDDITKWCKVQWPQLETIENEPQDVYDALVLAEHGRIKHGR
jgi:Holliday junction resolvasome RuvABC endonuclease subunit